MLTNGDHATPLTASEDARRLRYHAVTEKAAQMFGCRGAAYVWLHRSGELAAVNLPSRISIAVQSDGGMASILAELERIGPTLPPVLKTQERSYV